MHRVRLFGGALLLVTGACSSSRLPHPPYVGQKTEDLAEADYPPPPARVEFVPASPRDGAVWLDGEWQWAAARWAWKPGRWVTPPVNARYSPWTGTRGPLGTYYVAEGAWKDDQGQDLPDPPILAKARVRGGAVVNAEGEDVPRVPNVRAPRTKGPNDRKKKRDAGPPETPSGATPTGTEPRGDAGATDDDASPRMAPP